MRFPPGTRVRTSSADPDHHTRLPRYLRGHVGEVVTAQGPWPLPDDVARGAAAPRVETVYTVRFTAADLWGPDLGGTDPARTDLSGTGPRGAGCHTVTADLWESYLEETP